MGVPSCEGEGNSRIDMLASRPSQNLGEDYTWKGRIHPLLASWVIDGFVELVQAATITNEEALIIDIGASYTAYKLFRIRELRIAEELPSAKAKVEEIFKEELDHLRSKEKVFKEKHAKIIMGRPQALPQRILVSST